MYVVLLLLELMILSFDLYLLPSTTHRAASTLSCVVVFLFQSMYDNYALINQIKYVYQRDWVSYVEHS